MRHATGARPIYRKPKRNWKKKLADIVLLDGVGGDDFDGKTNRRLCIMEAIDYIQGSPDDAITDAPPCVSDEIRDLMIDVNDSWGDRKRAKLKQLVPAIIGTAPVDSKGQAITNDTYRRREGERGKLAHEFRAAHQKDGPHHILGTVFVGWASVTYPEVEKLVLAMAAVK